MDHSEEEPCGGTGPSDVQVTLVATGSSVGSGQGVSGTSGAVQMGMPVTATSPGTLSVNYRRDVSPKTGNT